MVGDSGGYEGYGNPRSIFLAYCFILLILVLLLVILQGGGLNGAESCRGRLEDKADAENLFLLLFLLLLLLFLDGCGDLW